MRLVGSIRPSEGRLEIFHNNAWGTVCSDNFDALDAATVYTMVRLAGGTKPANGRIEIVHNGLWGTMCDANFDQASATVVCTMLGYNNSKLHIPMHILDKEMAISFSNLKCAGTESDLEDCKYSSWNNSPCSHENDIGIDCATPVRLLGGRGPFEGTVELYHFGTWGELCDNNFDVKDAKVICRMLGYTSGYVEIHFENNIYSN
ncbi:Scavenger receptor cysteine-rich domain superfamily protein [Mytilus edulis]|uniref:Scavenger receptor cysteine-rich domain superfamily protein n=1 Tax=Mytilus edulis TaxID=6550 RepID=A0A8S3R2D8_MYTED|nr:Scavenger receptor cysteine-rich domain superfamily protein [Mytilus edulis]